MRFLAILPLFFHDFASPKFLVEFLAKRTIIVRLGSIPSCNPVRERNDDFKQVFLSRSFVGFHNADF